MKIVSSEAPPRRHLSSRGTVLVVEDDPAGLEVVTEAFRSFGYSVYPAPDGNQALALLRRRQRFDLLFTDVAMPNSINGIELAKAARLLYPDIRVLLASGYTREGLVENEELDENMAFIAKPYTLAALSEKLTVLTH